LEEVAVKPEVDRVFVCVLSTLPLRVLPPFTSRREEGRQKLSRGELICYNINILIATKCKSL